MSEAISLHPYAGLIAGFGFAVGCGYTALVYVLNHHRRLGWYWRQHSWLLVVAGTILMITFGAWALQSWLVFVVMFASATILGCSQIVVAVFDAGAQVQDTHEEHHAKEITRKA